MIKKFNTWLAETRELGISDEETLTLLNGGLWRPDHWLEWTPNAPSQYQASAGSFKFGELRLLSPDTGIDQEFFIYSTSVPAISDRIWYLSLDFAEEKISAEDWHREIWRLVPLIAESTLMRYVNHWDSIQLDRDVQWVRHTVFDEWLPIHKTSDDSGV